MKQHTKQIPNVFDLTVFAITVTLVAVGIGVAVNLPYASETSPRALQDLTNEQLKLLPMSSATIESRLKSETLSALDVREIRSHFLSAPADLDGVFQTIQHPDPLLSRNLVQVVGLSEIPADRLKSDPSWRQVYWACRILQDPLEEVFVAANSDKQLCELLNSSKLIPLKQHPGSLADHVIRILKDSTNTDRVIAAAARVELRRKGDQTKLARILTDLVFEHRCNDATLPKLAEMNAELIPSGDRGRLTGEVLGYIATRDFSQSATPTELAAERLFHNLLSVLPPEKRERPQRRFEKIRRPK